LPVDWEDKFRQWSKPSSATEAEKQANAQRMISDAVGSSSALSGHEVRVILQGSYRNNTNVRQESDVDVCVCCIDTFYSDFEFADYGKREAKVVDSTYSYAQFKSDVQLALERKFGKGGVTRGNKCFDVHENTYRVHADVVAAFSYRVYLKRSFNSLLGNYVEDYLKPPGTKFFSDTGAQVINWPEQQYSNGVAKNERTGGRFKAIVRSLKSLKYEMEEKRIEEARPISSFLVESLIYNVQDALLTGDSYKKNVRDCIATCFAVTAEGGGWGNWVETNGIKYLFHPSQPWNRLQVNAFCLAVWGYCGFA
jgi:hypothetical protein